MNNAYMVNNRWAIYSLMLVDVYWYAHCCLKTMCIFNEVRHDLLSSE